MKRAIILVRVSTQTQNYTVQEQVMYELAKQDGYPPENIITISNVESGIRLSEEQRRGLTKMKELIESDPDINAVYAFELDRIGRKKKVLFSIVDFLVNHHVNLIIKEPNRIELLNPDGTVNEASEMIITLFSQLAESEMRNRLARFRESKSHKKSLGKYIGGVVPVGYRVDEDKYLVPEPDNIVSLIYNMYKDGTMSCKEIAEDLQARGYFNNLSVYAASKRVGCILKDERYIGKPSRKGMVLPPLISEELFEQCRRVAEENRFIKGCEVKKQNDKTRMLKSLVVCGVCMHRMFANNSIDRYVCVWDNHSCKKSVIDRAVWFILSPIYSSYIVGKDDELVKKYEKQLKDLNDKIVSSEKKKLDLNIKIENIEYDMYVTGRLRKERGEKWKYDIEMEILEEEHKLAAYRNNVTEIQMIIEKKKNITCINVDDIYNIKDECVRFDICHEIIEQVRITGERYRVYKLEIILKSGLSVSFRVNTQTSSLEVEPDEWVKV